MKASGAGGPGTVSADVKVTLAEVDGATRLSYDADAIVGGVIGGVGQRMLTGVAKKMAGEFFGNVDDVLTGEEKVAPAELPAEASQPGVFVGPARAGGMAPGGQDFVKGAVFGAVVALAGVVVGALVGRRR
jgi:hypothetical protein